MSKHAPWFRYRAIELILLTMLAFWSLVWDYQHIGEYQRVGRIKFFLLACAGVAALKFGKLWHWSIGLLYFYLIATFLHLNFPLGGVFSVFIITGTLFIVPEIWDRLSLEAFEDTVLWAALIHCVVGAMNMQGIYPFIPITQPPQVNLPIGLLGQPTLLGPFLVFAFAIAMGRALNATAPRLWPEMAFSWSRNPTRMDYLFMALPFLIFALLTKSSMTAGSLAAVLVLLALFHGGLLASLTVTGGLLAAGLLACRYDPNFAWHSGRTEPWRDAWQLSKLSPWIGHGIGSWESVGRGIAAVRKEGHPWTYVHSEPIQWLFEMGRIGCALLLVPIVLACGRIRRLYISRDLSKLTYVTGFAVFGVNALANFDLHITPHGQIFALCLFGLLKFSREG